MDTRKEVKFHIDWATHESVVYACKNWHYSHSVPAGKLVKVGVWENAIFKGVVVFSRGANKSIGSPYGLEQTEVCELTRVALTKHYTPVTKIVSIAIKMLKKLCPDMKLIVSYADLDQNHEGIIYKAGNWVYTGLFQQGQVSGFKVHGVWKHKKTWHSIVGKGRDNITYLKTVDPKAEEVRTKGKHKFLYILDASIRPAILKLAVPTA